MPPARVHASLTKDEETNQAAWAAARGAAVGASKWGILTGLAGAAAYAWSPVYRGLTIQFKIYIQMAGMIVGGMVNADKQLHEYELAVRQRKRLIRDAEVWRQYEAEFEEEGTPGVASEGKVGRQDDS